MNIKNHIQSLVGKMLEVYTSRHECKKLSHKVIRGESKDTSAEFENLFGIMIGEIFGSDYTVLVGYQIQMNRDDWKSFKKPDILVYKNSTLEIMCIFDLKNDIGRYTNNWFIEANNWLSDFINAKSYRYMPKTDKDHVNLTVNGEIGYFLVSLNRQNSRDKLLTYSRELRIRRRADQNIKRFNYFILMNPKSLNDYKRISPSDINHPKNIREWKRLERQ
ncbi:hypothetical protein [Paenibacillus sp. HJGM_3]|uniref:hypothetical protein n=1 Tax=Paenibacillus sp. HJGM_3 TaxID=3379816 RepID=UPI00385E60C0